MKRSRCEQGADEDVLASLTPRRQNKRRASTSDWVLVDTDEQPSPSTGNGSTRCQELEAEEAAKEAAAQAVRDELAAFLCSGEVVIALIEGDGCVAAIRALTGSDDPELWPEQSDTLRGKFGEDKLRNVADVERGSQVGRPGCGQLAVLLREGRRDHES